MVRFRAFGLQGMLGAIKETFWFLVLMEKKFK